MGLAVALHADAQKHFPSGRKTRDPYDVSWAFRLLPFLEQSQIFNARNPDTNSPMLGPIQIRLLFVHPLVRFIAQVDGVRQLTGILTTTTSHQLAPMELVLQQVVIILPAVARILITQHRRMVAPTRNVQA